MGGTAVQAAGVGARPLSQGLLTYRERATPMAIGATPAQWARFVDAGLTADLLPVVSDRTIPIHPESKLRELGKTPSRLSGGFAVGIPKWTDQQTNERQVRGWSADERLGICIQTRRVRAIDIDVPDEAESRRIGEIVESMLGTLPVRTRSNSGKQLIAFVLEGDYTKRIIKSVDGPIEFLATGQQFIAQGTHPSGVPYEWRGLEVLDVLGDFPHVKAEEFEALWAMLAELYGKSIEVQEGMRPVEARTAAAMRDDVVSYLDEHGWVRDWSPDGKVYVRCPWKDGHSSDSGSTESTWFPAGVGGFNAGHYKCLHASCAHRTDDDFLRAVGWVENQFEPIPEHVVARDEVKRKGVPGAHHLTTDQANAVRIMRAFGKRLIVVADTWYVWTGKRWERDMSEVYRCACRLSTLLHEEAKAWRAKPAAAAEEADKHNAIADALVKWAAKSEMRSSIDAAVGLAKRMLAVDEAAVDRDPWLLNCANGTVDLRTGEIKPHDPDDYITKLCPVPYDPDARSEVWEQVIAKVTLETELRTKPLASFLQRWFGYCATGSTREQCFIVHYGSGSNGKSTILDTVADALGDYAGTAAPGLLVGSLGERHPTELADLFGRRMVTAHETGDGGHLREDVVKQITGSDKVKARYMRADFFEFFPTHKIQLLTNHKPIIKGTDPGIWRRVMLMPYQARFGSREDVNAGRAHFVKDTTTAERLKAELPGVLAWVARGAREWFAEGLRAPDVVLAASKDYQSEQDRVGQFIAESCEIGDQHSEALTDNFNAGLYPAYREWCVEGGYHALSKQRFLQEIERCVPGFRKEDSYPRDEGGKKRKLLLIRGLRLMV